MRVFQAALLALTALVAPAAVAAKMVDSTNVGEEFLRAQQWADFKTTYSKQYASVEEEALRFQIFKDNMVRAAQLNLENPEATFGVTPYVDLDPVEFKRKFLGYKPEVGSAAVERLSRPVNTDAPRADPNANVDWRTSGAVTPVKDQGQCGSCWAFSTVEGVESAWFLKYGNLLTLSPQQIVSCDKTDGGCDGGDLPAAFKYVQTNGLQSESSYPYASGSSGSTGSCKYSSSSVQAKITGFTYATTPCYGACGSQDETTLLNNLASTGPSSICVYADSWQTYVSGVVTSTSSCPYSYYSLDHCVQLVGYQAASPNNYWIVRNSWGTSWGQKGYIYLAHGKNVCGVADEATFATSA